MDKGVFHLKIKKRKKKMEQELRKKVTPKYLSQNRKISLFVVQRILIRVLFMLCQQRFQCYLNYRLDQF